jgi:hypothetical protein
MKTLQVVKARAYRIILVASLSWFALNSSSELTMSQDPTSIEDCRDCHGKRESDKAYRLVFKEWRRDPHAQAYVKLLNEDSQRIVAKLMGTNLDVKSTAYRTYLREQCVSCHANEQTPDSKNVEHGVDCFVCHGPVSAWGDEHSLDKTLALGSKRFDGTLRRNMESLVERAKMCTSCHVGEINRGPGLQDREVDHRLMAAGHPPTYFDFENYLERYLKHWDVEEENKRLGQFPPYERWRVGKWVSAQTRLKLLQERTRRTDASSNAISESPHDWPEFTEYSCTSCHYPLASKSWRQQVRSASVYTWDEWYMEGLELTWPGAGDDQFAKSWHAALSELRSTLESRSPNPSVIQSQTQVMIDLCQKAIDASVTPTESLLRAQLQRLLDNDSKVTSWETGAQWATTARMLSDSLGWKEIDATIEGSPPRGARGFFGYPSRFNSMADLPSYEPFDWFRPDALSKYRQSLQQQLGPKP